ncbi:protein sickie-like [Schistocerca serialis cubense]|uniref:protein sickie-like n=1 Tax=Schistocerca cancellata TaxID=274614 RepID=UPI0021182A20|nr:protein sickie-like [Schistocerca cancellata]XP_049955399.1 protein sickie-like [Schistocerca serialis cubense]
MAGCIRAVSRAPDDQHDLRTQKPIVQVYTDWANHYLEKARCKRRVLDLQADVVDGVLLADVIEAVTNHKVADINRKPKNSSQMVS